MTEWTYTDPYQWIRMEVFWPLLIGGLMALGVRFLSSVRTQRFTRPQAILSGAVGLLAMIVASGIALNWSGKDDHWLAFTIGLAVAALIVWANFVMAFWRSE